MGEFLQPSAALLNQPDTLPDIDRAVERIIAALNKGEPILVYGDYDADGVCGTALLLSVLKNLGGKLFFYLPHREAEGYGFSLAGVEFAQKNAITLIITNDCGSSDIAAITAANALGIDVIVTDHHEPGAEHPPAFAFINPKRNDSRYPFRELAGTGVAFKLAWRLLATLKRTKQELTSLLDLVGLATIADVVPLIDENRILARLGLVALTHSQRPGIRALFEISRIQPTKLTARDVSFGLAPRINAAGRVGHANSALELLLTEDSETARNLARRLEEMNRSRQTVEDRILNEALHLIETERKLSQRVLLLARRNWQEGVIGIVAGKLAERFWRPCIMVALKDGLGKGSGRSITGFNIYEALSHCRNHLLAFGGHRYAAGMKLKEESLSALDAAINAFADRLPAEVFQPTLHIEAIADLTEINQELIDNLARLEPYGPDNPEPIFATLGLEVVGYPRRIGRDRQHLKFKVRGNNCVLPAIAWERSSELLNLTIGKPNHLDICYTVELDKFNGRNELLLNILDLKTKD